jgi:ABC-type transport system substrate-binding protein
MKRVLSAGVIPMILGLALSLSAQQGTATPSTQTPDSTTSPSTQSPDTTVAQPQTQVDTSTQQRSAQSFEGKITRSGDKLVLQENASQTAYQLDDQDKAKPYEGKNVKVMATVDASNNTLHVVAITPVDTD